MSGPAIIFREIHRLRRNVKDLTTRIEQLPRQLKTHQGIVARQEEGLKQAQDTLKRVKVSTHEKEGSLRVVLQQIEKYEKQLNEIMSKKEFDALKHEIAHARAQKQKLEDEVLEVMAEAEDRAAKLPELEKSLQQARAEAAKFESESQSRLADLTEQRAQVLQKLTEIEGTLPEELKAQYNRLTTLRGEDALALVENRTCTACYTEITAQNYNELARAMFVLCKSCGRILYLPE